MRTINSSINDFCGSIFWNSTLTWNTEDPDFTPCFQKTFLVWVPCMFLWLGVLIEVYQMVNSKEANIPWNKLNCAKLVITGLLIIEQLIEIGANLDVFQGQKKVFYADYCDPVVKSLTFALAATLIFYNKKYGMRSSGVLFIFWLLLILAGLPQLRTEIRHYSALDTDNLHSVARYTVYYVLIVLMFVLSCFVDSPPADTPYVYDKRQCPEDACGFPSRVTFTWFDQLAITGYRRTLTDNDMWTLSPKMNSMESLGKFEKNWKRAVRKLESNESESECSETSSLKGEKKKKKTISVLTILFQSFGVQFFIGAVLKICTDGITFVLPGLLKYIVGFVESDEPVWQGYLYAVAMLICATIQNVVQGQFLIQVSRLNVKVTCALNSMIFKKTLSLSNEARKACTVGEIMNLMSTDTGRLSNTTLLHMLWSVPLQVAMTMYLVWGMLGSSALAGFAVIIVIIPINIFFMTIIKKYQTKRLRYKDERIKLMMEILNGMKVLKMYAWELSFQDYVLRIRNKEMKLVKNIIFCKAILSFIWFSLTTTIAMMTFACFVLVNDKDILDAKKAFVAISLFNGLRWPMALLPYVIDNAIQIVVSVKRFNKFLNAEELDVQMIQHNTRNSNQIVVKNGYFSWTGVNGEPVLSNVNVDIPRGSLVGVVGAVGSGKSSLFAALVGEIDKMSGSVNVTGTTAYVTEQVWIQNATVQNNILFGKPFSKIRYKQVIEACALKKDLSILPGGDQTEIGEKGINLSGGQRQRVSLARAIYFDADNYLLDDLFSSVDAHVGKHLFDEVIGPNGILKNKTRMFVTHNLSFLEQTDLVLVLQDGQVREAGKYEELLEQKGAFNDFLLHQLNNIEQDTKDTNDCKDLQNDLPGADPEIVGQGGDLDMKTNNESWDSNNVEREYERLIGAEKAETGNVKWKVYKDYFMAVGVWTVIITIISFGILQGLSLATNFWLVRWSDDQNVQVNGTVDTKLRDLYLGVYGGISLAYVLSGLLTDLVPVLACWRVANILHENLLKNLLRAPLHFFEVTPVGRLISRFSNDVDVTEMALPGHLVTLLNHLFEVTATVFAVCYSTPIFVTVVIPIGLLYLAIQRFYIPTSRQLMRMMSVARSPIFSHFNESILGASNIRAFGVKDRFVKESEEKVDYCQSIHYLSSVADIWLKLRIQIVTSLITFFAALFAVISRDTISPGFAGLSVSYTLQITQVLSQLVPIISSVETDIVAVERIQEYTNVDQEDEWVQPMAPPKSWPETGSVEFESLTVAYSSASAPALCDVTFTVEAGDKVGIVGRTGAGKSTLTLGLFRIVEAKAGRILIDGLDISKMDLHQLRSHINIIPQEPVLFSGTLRMNLDPFKTYSDDEIWHAVEHVHLKPFVLGLEAGLQHEILEGGENLSLGQRQLVCLARALLRKMPLLILDEATAAVDLKTEELIQKTIRSEFASSTVITIAHRLNTIMDSTRVMVLDEGRLIEYAPPDQLLRNKNSMFYSLAKDADLIS